MSAEFTTFRDERNATIQIKREDLIRVLKEAGLFEDLNWHPTNLVSIELGTNIVAINVKTYIR